MTKTTERVIRIADLAGTFVFAVEGAVTAVGAGLDPVGVVVLAFLTALGGGLIRDLLIGATPPAAVADWHYSVIVLIAAAATWALHPIMADGTRMVITVLDAAGLALFAVAGTEKALDHRIHPLVAVFLGTISGVGGGTMRDIVINEVPRVMRVDIYATAAIAAAVFIAVGRVLSWPPRATAMIAGLVCFALRLAAAAFDWQLPKPL